MLNDICVCLDFIGYHGDSCENKHTKSQVVKKDGQDISLVKYVFVESRKYYFSKNSCKVNYV